jgi:exodeoxyribonuclease-1
VGYNSLRFDDEVTRNTLYRNLYSPYDREWQNGNSRWDIIDMVRACHDLRPEGIVWPRRARNSPLPMALSMNRRTTHCQMSMPPLRSRS